jgi:hypothetical protein
MAQEVKVTECYPILKDILPFLTLLLGFLLGIFKELFDKRRKIKNMKTVLFKELSNNFSHLNKIISKDENTSLPPIIIALQCKKLSLSFCEAYLSKIDSLKENELNRVCDAYFTIKRALTESNEFIQAYEDHTPNTYVVGSFASKSIGVISYSKKSFEKIESFLRSTNGGKRFIDDSSSDRGSALSSYGEHHELWKKDKEGGWIIPKSAQKKTELYVEVMSSPELNPIKD